MLEHGTGREIPEARGTGPTAAGGVEADEVTVEHGPALELRPQPELGARPKVPTSELESGHVPVKEIATDTTSAPATVASRDPPTTSDKAKEVRISLATGIERPWAPVTTTASVPVYSQARVTSGGATTMSTHSTMTTPTSSLFSPTAEPGERGRRRSSSDGMIIDKSRSALEVEELSRVKLLVAAKTQKISRELIDLSSQAQSATGTATEWILDELRQIQGQLDRLEDLESTTWIRIAATRGKSAQKVRIQQWGDWQGRQLERVRQVKARVREMQQISGASRSDHQCPRVGHVEKVKLPTFSGKQEEFSEFKSQFREAMPGGAIHSHIGAGAK